MALLEGFELMNATPTTGALLTIAPNEVKFNRATAEQLDFPDHICLLVNKKAQLIAVRGCSATDAGALKFSAKRDKATPTTTVRSAGLTTEFTELLDFSEEGVYYSVPGELHTKEQVIIFALSEAKQKRRRSYGPRKKDE